MSIRDEMIQGLATRRLQPIGPLGIGALAVKDNGSETVPPVEIRQMNLNVNVKYNTGNEAQAKDRLMNVLYGETVYGLQELHHLVRNGLEDEACALIGKIIERIS